MTREEIESKIKEILVADFELDGQKLVPEAKLFEDLDLDSIDAVDMVVRLQQLTGLKVKAEDFKQIRTLGDITDVVEKLIAEQGR
ncbi:MAG: acyl carrier protein [Kiritimatiellae bacterium]|nr:acyl carrier protein [Kiritimatiellia bacterium]